MMGPRECSPSNSTSTLKKTLCSLPVSCPLQQADTSYRKMTSKAVGLENSFQNAPNSSHQQHASGSDDLDDSDCTSPSTELTEQCTDDCHFITCVDPTHKAANCTASGDTLACNDLEDCNGLEGYVSADSARRDFNSTFHSYSVVQICTSTNISLGPKVTSVPTIGIVARRLNTGRRRQITSIQIIPIINWAPHIRSKSQISVILKTVHRHLICLAPIFRASCRNTHSTTLNSTNLTLRRSQLSRRRYSFLIQRSPLRLLTCLQLMPRCL
ncbi:hypothetical protein DFJ43DRAFT_48397 [Lentinula guzmanii]|uniref:Uncharacterized protein n=1 Tax=Lentinula guzmanii TaxID=2804957 RepID=A0AA38J2E8_9AGAR|nr:hypothetical protein DFJ43DRAFT_48397 [Lentinula guzmanii]